MGRERGGGPMGRYERVASTAGSSAIPSCAEGRGWHTHGRGLGEVRRGEGRGVGEEGGGGEVACGAVRGVWLGGHLVLIEQLGHSHACGQEVRVRVVVRSGDEDGECAEAALGVAAGEEGVHLHAREPRVVTVAAFNNEGRVGHREGGQRVRSRADSVARTAAASTATAARGGDDCTGGNVRRRSEAKHDSRRRVLTARDRVAVACHRLGRRGCAAGGGLRVGGHGGEAARLGANGGEGGVKRRVRSDCVEAVGLERD
jgi:hypothetical protein